MRTGKLKQHTQGKIMKTTAWARKGIEVWSGGWNWTCGPETPEQLGWMRIQFLWSHRDWTSFIWFIRKDPGSLLPCEWMRKKAVANHKLKLLCRWGHSPRDMEDRHRETLWPDAAPDYLLATGSSVSARCFSAMLSTWDLFLDWRLEG